MQEPHIKHVSHRSSLKRGMKNPFHIQASKDFIKKIGGRNLIIKVFGILLLCGVIGLITIWGVFLRTAPDIGTLENGNFFRESTVIYDKDGGVIYSLFKDGKRTYVTYDNISQSIKDAIISTEDRTFFENPGVDFMGLVRAGLKYVIGVNDVIKGTSTISQQLIKNTLLTNERSGKRKIQEMYLSYRMNQIYSKEKILEMYLNAFSFGYNANGIEEASRTYFGKSAKEVGPLGATILASLPKGPTFYSPYLHRDRLMGKLEAYPTGDPESTKIISTAEDRKKYNTLYGAFHSYLSGMTMERYDHGLNVCGVQADAIKNKKYHPNSSGCIDLSFDETLDFLGTIAVTHTMGSGELQGSYTMEYTIGRKDFVANQMLEDGKIDGDTFKKILYDGLDFEFKKYSENIKFPYFVMYVKEYLENRYSKDIDVTNGLKVYTTIDPKLQAYAEEAVKKQVAINKVTYGANSAALVSMDNVSGKLLAMVGGPDYFDIENGGNNNMATATRQPGSSFKPIVYSLAIANNPIGPASPITDGRLTFGKWTPDNYDLSFKGVMSLETALDYSRNIPAIKMYYLAGKEEAIVKYAKGLGITSLKENFGYGAPLAIGTAEAKPMEMMQAYSVFANNGIKKPVYFIEKIEDMEGNTVEEHKDQIGEEVMNPAAAYIVAKILSNNDARPESSFWRDALTIPGRIVAAKTGTSNMEVGKGDVKKILPRDLWTSGFTPQITTVVWAGNVDGKATNGHCDGLNCAAAIWKNYMTFALNDLPKEDFKKPKDIYTYNISKLTGLLATKDTPTDLIRSTLMAKKLETYDSGMQSTEIDSLCNGPVTDETPVDARTTIYATTSKPIIDGYDPDWLAGFLEASGKYSGNSGSTLELQKDPCVRPKDAGKVTLQVTPVGLGKDNILEIAWSGNRIIRLIRATSGDQVLKEVNFGGSGTTEGKTRLNFGKNFDIAIKAIDVYGYQYTAILGENSPDISTSTSPKTPPTITMMNPRGSSLSLYIGNTFNLRFQASVSSATREISVSIDEKEIQNATTGEVFIFPVSSTGLEVGKHTVKISVTDADMQVATKTFTLNILPR